MIGQYSSKTANMMARQTGGLGFHAHLSSKRPGEGPRYKVPHLLYPNHFWFPNQGDVDVEYLDRENNSVYRWDPVDNKYYLIGFNPSNITVIDCGNAFNNIDETSPDIEISENEEVDDDF